MRKVVFIADFATRKKGDVWECDSMLASQLVNVDQVAKYEGEKAPKFEPKEDEETIIENEVVEEVETQETATEKPTKKAKK